MAGDMAVRRRGEIDDFCDVAEWPRHIKEAEQREGHRLQRDEIGAFEKHLPPENDEEEKEQRADFKIVESLGFLLRPREPIE